MPLLAIGYPEGTWSAWTAQDARGRPIIAVELRLKPETRRIYRPNTAIPTEDVRLERAIEQAREEQGYG